MTGVKFDYTSTDSQGTRVEPISLSGFDIDGYSEYEASLISRNREFWDSTSGVAVYRRFGVPQVFSHGCRNMKHSLGLQLSALQESMKYKADIANFLEPWYGIGTVPGYSTVFTSPLFIKSFRLVQSETMCKSAPFRVVPNLEGLCSLLPATIRFLYNPLPLYRLFPFNEEPLCRKSFFDILPEHH